MVKVGALLFLLFVSVVTYRHDRWGACSELFEPRRDHDSLLMLRHRPETSEWDFFLRALSLNRTSERARGDRFLFRPGTTGVLALSDIFLWDKPAVAGVLSFLTNGLTAFILCVIIVDIAGSWLLGLVAGTVLATHAFGSDAVLWRHISPYQLAVLFFGLGVLALRRGKTKWASGAFFLSCLFHETLVFGLPFYGAIEWFKQRRSVERKGSITLVYFLPSLAYLALNFLDYFLRGTTLTASEFSLSPINLLDIPITVGWFSGLFLIPQLIKVSHGDQLLILIALGLAVAGGFGLWVRRERKALVSDPAVNLAWMFLWTVLLGLYLGRVLPRGINYIFDKDYYFYFTNFAVLIILAGEWRRFRKPVWNFLLLVVCVNQIVFGYLTVYKHSSGCEIHGARFATIIGGTSRYFREHPATCYGGTRDPDLEKYLPEIVSYRMSCKNRKGFPLRAAQDDSGAIYFTAHK